MGLEQVQLFITTYLRNPEFRERYRGGQAETLEVLVDLNEQDRELIHAIDLDDLDRSAAGFRDERADKRRTEFEQFIAHLGVYGPIEDFYVAYDRRNPDGLLSRPLEMDRFLAFSTEFVLSQGLPEYLLDLLRFCYHYVQLADKPFEEVERELVSWPDSGLSAYHRIQLRKPYRIIGFRYDVLSLAQMQPSREIAQLAPQPIQLFMQKSRQRFKRTQIYYASDVPFLTELLDESSSLLELISQQPSSQMAWAVQQLEAMHRDGIIAVGTPSHFVE